MLVSGNAVLPARLPGSNKMPFLLPKAENLNKSSTHTDMFSMRVNKFSANFLRLLGVTLLWTTLGLTTSFAKTIDCPGIFSQLFLGALTAEEKALLAKAGFNKLKKKYGDGESLHFSSPFFEGADPQSARYRQNLYKGESRASQFVKRFLVELFPKAKFSSAEKIAGRRTLSIKVTDLGEHQSEKEMIRSMKAFESIPMHVVKPAIGLSNFPEREAARKSLGLHKDAKVVSIYIRSPGTVTDIGSRQAYPDTILKKFIPAVLESTQADAVILSFGNMDGSIGNSQIFMTPLGSWNRVDLTEGTKKLAPVSDKTLIINSTTGRMAEMHSAADMAVVVGPVNFFEPISLGVPTLIYRNRFVMSRSSMLRTYSETVYDQQIALAMQSGIARVANNPDEIADGVRSLQAAREPPKPIRELALPDFLRALRGHLERLDRVEDSVELK